MPPIEEDKDALVQRLLGEKIQLENQLEIAEANYIRVNEENAIQEQEIADLTRELLQTRTKISEMREQAIEEVSEPDSRVAWITLGFCAVAVAFIVGILGLFRR